jgi:hypothetical protein
MLLLLYLLHWMLLTTCISAPKLCPLLLLLLLC